MKIKPRIKQEFFQILDTNDLKVVELVFRDSRFIKY